MGPASDVTDDRRHRRRERTRAELSEVALRLALERGYEHVTADDIAEAADISTRTFFRYFATKDDVFFLDREERLGFLREAIRARPHDEPVRTSVREAILSLADSFEQDREQVLARARLVQETPSLRSRSADHMSEWQRLIADAVAERRGVDPDRDLRAQVVAATTVGAMQAAFNVWQADDGAGTIHDLVAEALELIAED